MTDKPGALEARTVATFYSSTAGEYQRLWAPELLRMSRHLLAKVPFDGVDRVLDVATGVGTLLPEIQQAAPAAFVVGIDLSEGMIRLAPDGFSLCVMDAMRLGLRLDSFDVAVIPFALFHLPDPLRGLEEMRRAIAPGGTVGTITWGEDPGYDALEIWSEELDRAGATEVEVAISRYDLVDSPSKVAALLDRAGFDKTRTWTGTFTKTFTPDEFLEHRTGYGSSRRRFESLNPVRRSDCVSRVRRRIAELGANGLTDTSEVIFALAERA